MTVLLYLGQQMVCLIVVVTNRSVFTGRKSLLRPMVAHVLGSQQAKARPAFILVAHPLNALVAA